MDECMLEAMIEVDELTPACPPIAPPWAATDIALRRWCAEKLTAGPIVDQWVREWSDALARDLGPGR